MAKEEFVNYSGFDKMYVVQSRDYGDTENYEIFLVRSAEGGWVASDPRTGFAETGGTMEEAARHLVGNMKVYNKRQFNV